MEFVFGLSFLGRYKEGWRYYEARFNCPDFEDVTPPTSGPALQSLAEAPKEGEEPLVVWSEQGMGDVIQFCRYLHLLEAASIPFVFLTRPCLVSLVRGMDWLWRTDPAVWQVSIVR